MEIRSERASQNLGQREMSFSKIPFILYTVKLDVKPNLKKKKKNPSTSEFTVGERHE